MIDFKAGKHAVDLLSLVPGMKKVANTNGGEYAGPCPFCQGKDRFRIQPKDNIWFCRQCGGDRWHDIFDFIMKRDNVDLKSAAKAIAAPAAIHWLSESKRLEKCITKYSPPDEAWQESARWAVGVCHKKLFSQTGTDALAYLLNRGITEKSIKKFQLGYSPGARFDGLYIPPGVVIPGVLNDKVWYVKIRALPGSSQEKYLNVKGSKPSSLFNGDDLLYQPFCLICEGEINCIIADQEIGDCISVCSVGSASTHLDMLTFGKYFLTMKFILANFDHDKAGDSGKKMVMDAFGDRVKVCSLPNDAKDLNDYFLAGGDLFDWINELLIKYNPYDPFEGLEWKGKDE